MYVCSFLCLRVCVLACVNGCLFVCLFVSLCVVIKTQVTPQMSRSNESSVLITLPQTHCLSVRVSVRSKKGARWPGVAVTSNLISLLLPQVAMKIIDKSKLCKGDLARLFREVWS